jgi:hypothetical protein
MNAKLAKVNSTFICSIPTYMYVCIVTQTNCDTNTFLFAFLHVIILK